MTNFQIRRATIGDEIQLAQVHIQAWQESYRGLISDDYLTGLSNEMDDRLAMWKSILANPKRWAWVATVADKIVGFILFGPPRDENREAYIELGAIYLLAAEKNKGIGFALLSSGFKHMKSLGYEKSYCWVLEGNPTIAFYEKSGATFRGQTKLDEIAGKEMKELAYEWPHLDLPPKQT